MIFISGTKTGRKKLGWVADFCTTCQEPTPFKLFSIRRAKHVYFLPTSNRGTVGHEKRCSKCKAKQSADPLRYTCTSRYAGANIAVLADETNPTLSASLAARTSAEDLYRTRDAVATDVETEVASALLAGYTAVRNRRDSGHIDPRTLIALLGFASGLGLIFITAGNPALPPLLYIAAFALSAVSVIAILWAANTAPFRFASKRVMPHIEGAISCLSASEEDVRSAAARLKRLDIDVKKVMGRKILGQLEASVACSVFSNAPPAAAPRRTA